MFAQMYSRVWRRLGAVMAQIWCRFSTGVALGSYGVGAGSLPVEGLAQGCQNAWADVGQLGG